MTSATVIAADPGRLSPITLHELVLAGFCRSSKSAAQLSRSLKAYASSEAISQAVEELNAQGMIEPRSRGDSFVLTKRGTQSRLLRAAVAAKMDLTKVKATLLPCAALGLGLGNSEMTRFTRVDNLRAAALAVLYGLDLEPRKATLTVAREQLLDKSLRSKFPELASVVTNGKASLDPFSVSVLRSIAGLERGNLTSVVNALACGGLKTKDHGSDGFRQALVRAAINVNRRPRPDDFSSRVQALVAQKTTPPFSDRLAVGTLYDVYGREYHDARSLSDFKGRLIDAHQRRQILLRRLDNTRAIDADLRKRSEIDWEGHKFHFVARASQ